MGNRITLLSALAVVSLALGAADAAALEDRPALSSVAAAAPAPWLVRAEGSFVPMRDSWLGILVPEVGLTVGRDLISRFSVELTGNIREPDNDHRRSWSAAAAARLVAIRSASGRHALTVAGGPFVEIDNVVHGTLPFARGELAYVYRAPIGLTVLAGGGLNVALASSPYVSPPPTPCATGDSPSFCLNLGPDAQEIHAGDAIPYVRLAVGWLF